MQAMQQKEFQDVDGNVCKVKFANGLARLDTNGKRYAELSLDATKWLLGEMEQKISSDSVNIIDVERIYFFTGEVEEARVLAAQQDLLKLAYKIKRKHTEPVITIILNSPGGYCTDGFALFDTIELIQGMGIKVVGIVMGVALSMGSCLLQSCNVRLVGKHSRIMIHEVGADIGGKLHEIQTDINNLVAMNEVQARCFADRNTKDHNDIEFWVDYSSGKDKYLSADESVELGVADAIYNGELDVSKYLS